MALPDTVIRNPTYPHCPHCNVQLKRVSRDDWAPEDDTCWTADIGECPRCGRPYRWTQFFKVCGYDDLQEGWYED